MPEPNPKHWWAAGGLLIGVVVGTVVDDLAGRTGQVLGILAAAAVLWVALTFVDTNKAGKALKLGKEYLGFATSLAGVFGLALGVGSALTLDPATLSATTAGAVRAEAVAQAQLAAAQVVGGVGAILAGGTMVGGDNQWGPAAALGALGLSTVVAYLLWI